MLYRESLLALKSRISNLEKKSQDENLSRQDKIGNEYALKTQKYKYKAYLSQRGKCCFCEEMMFADSQHYEHKKKIATIEHVIPKKLGGKNEESNYKLSCDGCNNLRGVMDFDKFKKYRISSYFENKPTSLSKNARRTLKKRAEVAERVNRVRTCFGYRFKVLKAIEKNPTEVDRILKNYNFSSVGEIRVLNTFTSLVP